MRYHPRPPQPLQPLLLFQSLNSMKRSPGLERSNPLEILALEPEPDLWVRWLFNPLPLRSFQLLGRARGGSELVESCVRQNGRLVDVGLYEGVSGEDGGAG